MEDAAQEKWFAVQLAVSDQPVNLDAMPRLDIFEAYRLYSVASAGSGKIVHSLRLGFFKEAVSAEAVMGYLQTFFGSPTVMRVSVAEHARFQGSAVDEEAGCAGAGSEGRRAEQRARRTPGDSDRDDGSRARRRSAATGSFRPLEDRLVQDERERQAQRR
jgi:hypothetical protein